MVPAALPFYDVHTPLPHLLYVCACVSPVTYTPPVPGLARDFVAPVTLASVAIPFCDERGHVVSGKHVLRLWTNRHDVVTMPPGQPCTPVPVGAQGDGGVELHVEFDSFAGTVATAVPPSLWSLSTAVAQGGSAGVAVAPAVMGGG